MLEHKFAENGVFLSNGARESRTAIWGVKVKKNPRKGLDLTIILPGILFGIEWSKVTIVGLRIVLLREMVFILYLKLILDYFCQRNPMVPTTF